jgi:hypothetical protein
MQEIEQLAKSFESDDVLLPFGTESLSGIVRKHAGKTYITLFNPNTVEYPCPIDIEEIAMTGTRHLAIISKSTPTLMSS